MRRIDAAIRAAALSGLFLFRENCHGRAMPDHGAPGAESRGFRYPLLFLLPVHLVAVAGYPVEKLVASDARGAGQVKISASRATTASGSTAPSSPPPVPRNGPASGHRGYRRGRWIGI
jgi:hypothetical protein